MSVAITAHLSQPSSETANRAFLRLRRKRADRTFDGVVAGIDPAIGEEGSETVPAGERLADRLAKTALGACLPVALFEEPIEVVDDLTAALVADPATLVVGDGRVLGQLVKLAARLRPAQREVDMLMAPRQRGIGTIAVNLRDPCKALEMRLGPLSLAIGNIDISNHRQVTAAPWPIVASIGQ